MWSSDSSSTWFQGTHRIEKLSETEFLLYGSPTNTQSITTSSGPRVFRKKRFQILGAPSSVYFGDQISPQDDINDLRSIVSDLEPRKKVFVSKGGDGVATGKKEVATLMPTRVRNVSYFKADDMLGYKTTSQSDDRFARIAYCAGYTDEFQTIRIPKNQQFETILNEDLGNADGNVLKWQYQYFFPTSLSVLGLDSDYSVTFESYDLDGNSVLDRYGEEVIESIEAIDKTVKGFKIQFVLNKSAFQFGDSFSETQDEPEGGRVKQDVIVRFKLNDEYAVPIILPSFAFDGPVGEDQDFSAQRLLYGAKIETPIEGESLLASGVTAEASAGVTTGNWGNELVQQINEGSTGWDLPLWVKKKVFVRRVTLTGSHRP